MPSQDTTVKFKADISNLKASMQEAGRLARLAKGQNLKRQAPAWVNGALMRMA